MTQNKTKQQPKPAPKPNTQKYPFYPKPNKAKWQSEVVTKKDQRELNDYYGKDGK